MAKSLSFLTNCDFISITTEWNSEPIKHQHPAQITSFIATNDGLQINMKAEYFNDPAPPKEPAGSVNELWEYEVVEVFLMNRQTEEYIELEFDPHGHFLVLLLRGPRGMFKTGVPIEFSTSIDQENRLWNGTAVVPWIYLPSGVDSFNCFAIYGSGESRRYEALFPVPTPALTDCPNFHRLELLGPIGSDAVDEIHRFVQSSSRDLWMSQ